MKRSVALKKFYEEAEEILCTFHKEFFINLAENGERLFHILAQAIDGLIGDAQKHGKECRYIYCFVLRYEILRNEFCVHMQAVDKNYIFDETPMESWINIDFLFGNVEKYKNILQKESRKYCWKVNEYDVEAAIMDCVISCQWKIAYLLRFLFRIYEYNPQVKPLTVRWGEYRDRGETVCFRDNSKTTEDLKELLNASKVHPYMLQCYYFTGSEFKTCICKAINFQYAEFRDCLLEDIVFDGSNLTGVSFKNCTIINCSFVDTIMELTSFEDCIIDDTNWENAVFFGTFFKNTDTGQLSLSDQQRGQLVLEEKEFNEKILFYGAG